MRSLKGASLAARKFISWSIVHHFKKTSSGRQSHTDMVTNVVILFYNSCRKLAHISWIMVTHVLEIMDQDVQTHYGQFLKKKKNLTIGL